MNRDELLKVAKPILFNTEMVRAIQGGRKKVTRRIAKPQPKDKNDIIYKHPECGQWFISPDDDNVPETRIKPPYKVGDVLYVRETWAEVETVNGVPYYIYKANDENGIFSSCQNFKGWKPSIHMPKEAARGFLRVTDVRVERLQDMTEEDAFMEGFSGVPWCAHSVFENYTDSPIPCEAAVHSECPPDPPCNHSITELFGSYIWDKTVKKSDLAKYGWDANPWVWVIEFERVEVT